MATKLSLNAAVNHEELAKLLVNVGRTNTIVVTGEPGIGKSAILNMMGKYLPNHLPIYVDAPVFDIPDIYMPMVDITNTDAKGKSFPITRFAPNELWHLHGGKPLLIMIDELLKAAGPTKLILTRLILERTLGDFKLPEGSIVFATSNNVSDGVGDSMAAHLQSRVGVVALRKPNAKQWLNWAFDNNIAPEVCAWVRQFPHCMNSYTEVGAGKTDNPYIFDPVKTKGQAYVCPRSLAKASFIVNARQALGENATKAALAGTIGAAAAADMAAFLNVADKLPAFESVLADPKRCPLPDSEKEVAALLIMMFGAAARASEDTINKIVTYVERAPLEMQMLFMRALTTKSANSWSHSAACVRDWHLTNKKYIVSDIDD